MIKDNCFAYEKICKKCIALNDLYCKNEVCKFYKTASENEKEEKQARKNIKNKHWRLVYDRGNVGQLQQ